MSSWSLTMALKTSHDKINELFERSLFSCAINGPRPVIEQYAVFASIGEPKQIFQPVLGHKRIAFEIEEYVCR